MQLRQTKGTRVRAGVVPALLAFLRAPSVGAVLATAACLFVAGCSPGAEYPPYPSIFATTGDSSPPRTDTPMDPVQVQKATEDLITERDRLNAQAPNSQGQGTANGTKDKAATTASVAKKKAAKGAPQRTAAVPPATAASAQGAGVQSTGAQAAGTDLKP